MFAGRATPRLIGAFAVAGIVFAAGLASGHASDLDALAADIDGIVGENNVRGGGYAIVENGAVVVARPFGYADAGGTRPVTTETLFRVGSVSKLVTSLLAMTLVEEGAIDLDAAVSAIVPDAGIDNPWHDAAPLRLAHLLEHTGGLPGSSYYEYAQQGDDLSPSDYLERMRGRLTLRWPPGRYYSYANGGHTIAARMLEVAAGKTFDDLVRERVFAPLGMTRASYSTLRPPEDMSESFAVDGSIAPAWPMAIRPSGSLSASLGDMAQFALFLATEGASVATAPVSTVGLRRMQRGETSLAGRNGYGYVYGLGMFGFLAADRVFWGHWGKTEGFLANLGVLPRDGRGFVLLSNTSNRRAMAAMRDRLAAYVARDLAVPPAPTVSDAKPDADFAGLYVPFTHDSVLRSWLFALVQAAIVDYDNGTLSIRPFIPFSGKAPLTPVSDRFFRSGEYPFATHLFLDDDGETVLFGDGQESYRKLSPLAAIAFVAAFCVSLVAILASLAAALIVLIGRLTGRAKSRLAVMVIYFGGAGAVLVALIAGFIWLDLLAPFDQSHLLGEPGARALLLMLLSLLWPLLALLASIQLARHWRGLPLYGRGYGVVAALGFLIIAGTMVTQDWLPLVTWRA